MGAVDALAAELVRMLDATEVSLLVANFSGTAAVRMSHVTRSEGGMADGRNERKESFPLNGSPRHRVLTSQEQVVESHGDGWRVLVPVTERGDAIGILELTLPHRPDTETLRYLTSAAHALAYTVVAARRHTDLFEWAQRDVPFSLPAEIQRRLLPDSYTVEGGPFTLAGWLEPAASVGGDTFDYSVDREYLYASVSDAVGHAIGAALLATLAVGSLRNTRRSGASPREQANAANAALIDSSASDEFVTAQILRIRIADGAVDIVNAGHPLPYLLRDGAAAAVDLTPGLPLGISRDSYETHRLTLEPGDRLLIVTDGFLERNADIAIGDILVHSADRHPREVVRELARDVLDATGGDLRDDATVLCIDWYGPRGVRNATGGASLDRATSG
ncbi:MAG TPA: PP2C family protein-serine/threonine phosphatase [Acidimicrobiales bacterium]|nr:PP2C family protein-serine/threonine phosphatase [Acidimicrobiales bacterium]